MSDVKLRVGALAAAVLIAGCGGSLASPRGVASAGHTASAASCAFLSPAQQLAMAHVVFVGRMLPGPSIRLGGRQVLGSPARVRVVRYLKGSGSRTVEVATAVRIENRATSVTEDGIEPQLGEIWKIYSDGRRQPFGTSVCGGSAMIKSAARVALDMWSDFPVAARARPIVALGEGSVLDPAGFPDGETKMAYDEGRFVLHARLPKGPAAVGRLRLISAAAAYRQLRATGRSYASNVSPLVVRAAHLGSATFQTDRGERRLPAWQLSFKRVTTPASVLALAPPDLFTPPSLQPLGPPGPGNSIEDSATADRSGRAIKISFIGAARGTGPCDARYAASAVTSRHAVAFTIRTITHGSAGTVCDLVGHRRTTVLHLARALGARVLISTSDGGAVPVTRSSGGS